MVEETWAQKRRSLTIHCNKALEAAIKVCGLCSILDHPPALIASWFQRDFDSSFGPGDGPAIVTIEDVAYGTLHCPPRVTKENWEGRR
jgi:hypothetical protein